MSEQSDPIAAVMVSRFYVHLLALVCCLPRCHRTTRQSAVPGSIFMKPYDIWHFLLTLYWGRPGRESESEGTLFHACVVSPCRDAPCGAYQ